MDIQFEPLVIINDGCSTLHDWFRCATPEDCYKLIESIVKGDPDVDLVLKDPLSKTAHWDINCDGYYPYCSNCREEPQGGKLSPYCPNCGAEMVTRGDDL